MSVPVISKVRSIDAVRNVVLPNPLVSVLSTLGGNFNYPGWTAEIDLKNFVISNTMLKEKTLIGLKLDS